jgi:GNAT superfamily N-acetyltransferase
MESLPVIIRPARPEEADVLTALARRSKASWGYPTEWLAEWGPLLTFTRDSIGSHMTLVAELGGRLAGLAVLQVEFGEAELAHLWVDPADQGRGIGSALLRSIADAARDRGHRSLRIESDPNAKPFYESQGAVLVGWSTAPILGLPRRLPILQLSLDE